ncbi:MAG TPA: hypothetical protein VGJ22_06455 [Anaerolineales bacterium]|jgi:hypothetical protein
MTRQEKILYHQIHPLKLFTDWSAGFIALYFFWQHQLVAGLLAAFIPAILASILVISFFDLEKYKASPFGGYVREHMTRPVEAARGAGYALMALGAWVHAPWLIPLGLTVVLLAWMRWLLFPETG